MGVNLHAVERMRGAAQVILRRDFERDMQNHIRFLNDCGVTGDSVGVYISKNPFIFTQDLDNLEVRINYLFSKQFTTDSISRILVKNPRWLMHSTEDIDRRLGYFQQNFLLKGDEVRFVATRQPKLITYNLDHIRDTRFAVIEEMGFTVDESKQIILRKPKVYTLNRRSLVERFDYIHNTMGIGHGLIIEQVGSLLSRLSRLKQRHQFLALLGRNIYDPAQPGYISLVDIVAGDDSCFCSRVAKTPTAIFNKFLKTL
ncbi:hypothetical protein AAG570_001740 [Ranatra chinensis]|uniref:Uncharacterized protein n=1 Tax=Ranatra chinensis TaxID=642074 RepID=A0ABD0Y9E8_9HEMI